MSNVEDRNWFSPHGGFGGSVERVLEGRDTEGMNGAKAEEPMIGPKDIGIFKGFFCTYIRQFFSNDSSPERCSKSLCKFFVCCTSVIRRAALSCHRSRAGQRSVEPQGLMVRQSDGFRLGR